MASILKDGHLRTVPDKKSLRLKEKPIMWLSSNPTFEKTASKIIMKNGVAKLCNMEETEKYCNGLYRFVFNEGDLEGVLSWPRVAVEARMPEKVKQRLIKRGKKAKVDPRQWFGVLNNVDILSVKLEKRVGKKWVEVEIKDEVRKISKEGHVVSQGGSVKRLPVEDAEWSGI